jgi:hypothetical protein
MDTRDATSVKATASLGCLLALSVAAAIFPVAAQASVVETFDWVSGTNTPENPTSAQSTQPSGTLTLTFSSFALTTPTGNPNLGPYYTSGSSITATITGFSYTAGDGQTANLSEITASTEQLTTTWATSAVVTPSGASSSGYYLVNAFNFSGTSAQGAHFQIGNAAGTAGANYSNGVGNGDNSFNAAGSIPAITDGGYWELASVTAVPLPATLPLLLSGFAGLGILARSRKAVSA